MTSVAVILLNYKNYDPDTRRCLASLAGITAPAIQAVVVENASGDGSEDRVVREFPDTVVLRQERNLGFAGGNNRGIEYALAQGFDYVLILNNDTEVADKNIIRDMIAALEENERIGVIGPRILDAMKGEEQTTTLTAPSWTLRQRLFARPRHKRESIAGHTESVEGLSAVCWLIPARVFESVGLLDEHIFMYGEDNEFCYRVRKAGWLIGRYTDRVAVRHYLTSTTISSLSALRHRLAYVNYLYALRKHGASLPLGALLVGRTALALLKHLVVHSPKKRFAAEVTTYVDILRDLLRQLARGRTSIRLIPSSR